MSASGLCNGTIFAPSLEDGIELMESKSKGCRRCSEGCTGDDDAKAAAKSAPCKLLILSEEKTEAKNRKIYKRCMTLNHEY